ncbi:MAG: hypothetical protein QXU62_02880 [Thermofilaceae archaeon]
MKLSPELESFLRKLKEKYGVSDADFAKLVFLLDDWAEELRDKMLERAVEVVGARL